MLRMSSSATDWMLCVLELPRQHQAVSMSETTRATALTAPRGAGSHLTTKAAAQRPSVTTEMMAAACTQTRRGQNGL